MSLGCLVIDVNNPSAPWTGIPSSQPVSSVDPLRRIKSLLFSETDVKAELLSLVSNLTVHDLKPPYRVDHPILHEAMSQADGYIGAHQFLEICFEDPRFRPLFTDLSYTDKYGLCPIARMRPKRTKYMNRMLDECEKEWGCTEWNAPWNRAKKY